MPDIQPLKPGTNLRVGQCLAAIGRSQLALYQAVRDPAFPPQFVPHLFNAALVQCSAISCLMELARPDLDFDETLLDEEEPVPPSTVAAVSG